MKKPNYYYSESEWDRLGCGPLPPERDITKVQTEPSKEEKEKQNDDLYDRR